MAACAAREHWLVLPKKGLAMQEHPWLPPGQAGGKQGAPFGTDRQTDRQTKYCLVELGQEREGGSWQAQATCPHGDVATGWGSGPTWGHPSGSPTPAGCPCPRFGLEPLGRWGPGVAPAGGSVSPWGHHRRRWVHRGLPAGAWHGEHRKAGFSLPSRRYPRPQAVTLLGDGQCQPGRHKGRGRWALCPPLSGAGDCSRRQGRPLDTHILY